MQEFMQVYHIGMPIVLSDTIKPIEDESIEHKLNGPHKVRNIYFMLNTNGESYYEIFKENTKQ